MRRLTCVNAVLVSGAVAAKGEGDARESAACCCCWDVSEAGAPMVATPAPGVDPSAAENTPVIKPARTASVTHGGAEQWNMMALPVPSVTPLLSHHALTLTRYLHFMTWTRVVCSKH